jgi:hypothetical protein
MANHDVTIERTACDTYKITNASEYGISIKVEKLNVNTYEEELEWTDIEVAGDYTYEFTTGDGVYRLTIAQTGPELTYIDPDYYEIVIYCAIQTCMLSIMKNLVCSNNVVDCTVPNSKYGQKLYFYNSLMLTWYVFMLELNAIQTLNWAYTTLDPNDLDRLSDVNSLITRMESYCACVTAIDGSTSDCGCS